MKESISYTVNCFIFAKAFIFASVACKDFANGRSLKIDDLIEVGN